MYDMVPYCRRFLGVVYTSIKKSLLVYVYIHQEAYFYLIALILC